MTDLCCGCSSFYRVLPLDSFLAFLLVIHLTLDLRLIQTIYNHVFPFLNIHWSPPSGKRIDGGWTLNRDNAPFFTCRPRELRPPIYNHRRFTDLLVIVKGHLPNHHVSSFLGIAHTSI